MKLSIEDILDADPLTLDLSLELPTATEVNNWVFERARFACLSIHQVIALSTSLQAALFDVHVARLARRAEASR